jgi:hypothetical protein
VKSRHKNTENIQWQLVDTTYLEWEIQQLFTSGIKLRFTRIFRNFSLYYLQELGNAYHTNYMSFCQKYTTHQTITYRLKIKQNVKVVNLFVITSQPRNGTSVGSGEVQ